MTAETHVAGRMEFTDALIREMYETKLALQLDMTRTLFWCEPTLGPPAPVKLVRKYRLVAEGYVAPPPLRTRLRRRWSDAAYRVHLARRALRGDDLHEGCDY